MVAGNQGKELNISVVTGNHGEVVNVSVVTGIHGSRDISGRNLPQVFCFLFQC